MAQKNRHQFQGAVEVKDTSGNGEAEFEIMNQVPFRRSSGRYYLEEFFSQRPALNAVINTAYSNADATNSANTAIRLAEKVANRNFETLGTNATTALVTFSATRAAITLTTAGADGDQIIILPHLDSAQSAWAESARWGSENSVEWECAISTASSIADMAIWAGLKKTNTQAFATDSDQVYFAYDATSSSDVGALDGTGHATTWQIIVSSGGADYVTSTDVTVAASSIYRFRIAIDSDRKASAWINDKQYVLEQVASTGTSGLGTTTELGQGKSVALADNIDLVPYVGVMDNAGAAKAIDLHYEKISRILFE